MTFTQMDNTITVFTPSYNRANLLPRLFESLKNQTFKNFEWLIVDDGSTDDTEEVINLFKKNNTDFPIIYFKKENGGKHTAINRGVKEARGELFFIADSDDRLPYNALELVLQEFSKVKSDVTIGGIAGLDMDSHTREIIGGGIRFSQMQCNAMEIRYKYGIKGDLKEVFRTSALREFPFPEIEGERFCPEQLIWFRIAQKYKLHYFNKVIYNVEYLEDGLTKRITKARMNSPIATIMTYAEMLDYSVPLKAKIKAAINYWRFRFCSDKKDIPYIKWFWFFLKPLGWLMHQRDLYKINSQG
ncbi:MAG: glycosyltransferase family 2 protein [Prevotella sp.]|nr:glycosyltransferase family 2 protein [Prevotella sp.]